MENHILNPEHNQGRKRPALAHLLTLERGSSVLRVSLKDPRLKPLRTTARLTRHWKGVI